MAYVDVPKDLTNIKTRVCISWSYTRRTKSDWNDGSSIY